MARVGAPYGLYVHGNNDATGAVRAVESITKALGWTAAHEPVTVAGGASRAARDAVWELAATVAASLAG